jgi:ferric enterobactin receptor
VTLSDQRNFWSGNPDLQPEFSDVFDLGHVHYFERGSLASSLYYRHTKAKIERIRTVSEQGFAETYPQNLRSEDAFGVEFTCGYTPVKWWKVDLNANFFEAHIDGSNIPGAFRATTQSWFLRHTSKFSLPKHLDLQCRFNYEAPQKTAQGSRKALYFMDLAASKDILNRNGTLTFSVSDVFNTRRWRTVVIGDNFYTESDSQWRVRQVNLTFNYRVKQKKGATKRALEE